MEKMYEPILKDILKEISPNKEKLKFMDEKVEQFIKKINKRIKKLEIDLEIFVGGSFAKKTLIKKDIYDADIYFRFNPKYKDENLTKLTKKILRWTKKVSTVHGSRDYFRVKINSWFELEIIPVKKIKKIEEAKNITDLSYSHVKYIRKKIKSKKILDEIKLAKAFCYASKTYGAESYVQGFSGYSLELLIYYFGGFIKFLKESSKKRKEKLIIDIENFYKNKKMILLDINSSKLESPIILIDPTFRRRNVLAALSEKTYEKFRKSAKEFLKKPSIEFFRKKKIDFKKIKEKAKKEGKEFILIKTKTKKQEGDIAGTKLLKFSKHLKKEFERFFEIIDFGFEYVGKREGISYFILKHKKEIINPGPLITDKKNVKKFKEQHKKTFIKNKKIYSKKKINFTAREFFPVWATKNKRKIKEMYISKLKIIN
jgi:tRNA nucleotidyltransferase (CCA-adding enzyme)